MELGDSWNVCIYPESWVARTKLKGVVHFRVSSGDGDRPRNTRSAPVLRTNAECDISLESANFRSVRPPRRCRELCNY